MECPKCAVLNADSAKFCKACGFNLQTPKPPSPPQLQSEMPVTCTKCRSPNSQHAKFCRACGDPLMKSAPANESIQTGAETPAPRATEAPVRPAAPLREQASFAATTAQIQSAPLTPSPTRPVAADQRPQSRRPPSQKNPWTVIAWAAVLLLVVGAGSAWMLVVQRSPVEPATAKAETKQGAPAALPSPPAASMPAVPVAPRIAEASSAAPIALAPAVATSASEPRPVASAPTETYRPVDATAKPIPVSNQHVAATSPQRRKATEEPHTRQQQEDAERLKKANRTLDDLLK